MRTFETSTAITRHGKNVLTFVGFRSAFGIKGLEEQFLSRLLKLWQHNKSNSVGLEVANQTVKLQDFTMEKQGSVQRG